MASLQWLRTVLGYLNPSLSETSKITLDYSKVDIDLLSNLFGTEEARKQLLNIVPADSIRPEQVLKDSQAMELMLKTYPWKIYEQAIWRNLLTALRSSLTSDSLERREAWRNRTLAHLADLHLPFELKFEADRIRKVQEMTKAAQEKV